MCDAPALMAWLLPPPQVMSEERTARIPLLLPQLAPLFTPAAMQRAASLLEVLLEAHSSAELHVVDKGLDRLHRCASLLACVLACLQDHNRHAAVRHLSSSRDKQAPQKPLQHAASCHLK